MKQLIKERLKNFERRKQEIFKAKENVKYFPFQVQALESFETILDKEISNMKKLLK